MNVEAMNNIDLDLIAARKDRGKSIFRYQTLEEIQRHQIVAKLWLLKGVLAKGETSAWIGPPGSLKSALATQMLLHASAGIDWHGHRSKFACAAIYFALERGDLVRRRLTAQMLKLSLETAPPIAVVSEVVDLMTAEGTAKVIATIRAFEEECGELVELVAFDTVAKLVAAGGGDENQAKDMGRVFANLQRIKNATGVHIVLVGHTGKDTSRGARGSSAFLGDVDVMIEISGDLIKTATVTKANDMPEGALFSFKGEVHEFGKDEDGDPITVNIVSSEDVSAQVGQKSSEPKLTANQKTMFGMLHDAGQRGLTVEEWNGLAKEAGIGVKRKADLNDVRSALKAKGLIRPSGDRWQVVHS